MNASSVAVVWFGAGRIDSGAMEVGSLVAFLNYLMQILMSVLMASMMFMLVPRASVSADRLGDARQLVGDLLVRCGEVIERIGDLAGETGPVARQPDGDIAVAHRLLHDDKRRPAHRRAITRRQKRENLRGSRG